MVTVQSIVEKSKGKYMVNFDDGLSLPMYRSEIKSMKLMEASSISEEAYHYILKDIVGKRAIKRAMHLLEKMDRTEYKLREKLKENGYPDECIDIAIDYVSSYHYLDDYRYAETFIRIYQEKYSKQQLKQKLFQRGVPREIIDETLDSYYEMDEKNQIKKLMEKRRYSPTEASEKEQQKMYQFLLRRGFKNSDILSLIRP